MKTKIQTGQKISHLTVVGFQFDYKFGKRKVAICECVCGEKVLRRTDYLHNATRDKRICSCGCLHPVKMNKGKNGYTWTGIGQISGMFIAGIKGHAKIRDIKYELTNDYIWQLYLNQNKKCALTGIEIGFQESRRTEGETTASLDRIDSSKGYIEGNVQWVHKDINKMKNNIDLERFIFLCRKVAELN